MADRFEHYMQECLSLAEQALRAGNPPVGAIIVHGDEIIGRGIESGKSTGDITNHAEILSVRDALANGHGDKLRNAEMFTTHEPCLMCSCLLRHHRIPAIVFGTPVSHIGGFTSQFGILTTEAVPKWGSPPVVVGGVLRLECEKLSKRYEAIVSGNK